MTADPAIEEVAMLIEGERFERWGDLEITRSVDSFATCAFRAPFEPEYREFRERFRPFSFKPMRIGVGEQTLFPGVLVGIVPDYDANASHVEVTGYAAPAVLDDCNAPASTAPHQFQRVTLRTIAEALAKPFGIRVVFEGDDGPKFRRVKLEDEQKILAFLAELAKQQNRVWTNTDDGLLLCWKSVTPGNPVGTIIAEPPITTVKATFNPQDCFGEITGIGTRKRGTKGGKHTEKNPWIRPGVIRPLNFKLDDTDPANVKDATRARMGRMFAGIASWSIPDIPTWRAPNGEIWAPNTTLIVEAPRAMIYRRTELLIREVKLRQSGTKQTADLEVVLPGAFSGEVPAFMPWDEPIGAN